jgi:hypothetical protein
MRELLITDSISFRKGVFGDLFRNGEALMLHQPDDRLELIEEIKYYGRAFRRLLWQGMVGFTLCITM